MHLVIISGAARARERSNTAKIITAFLKGLEENGGSAEIYYLSDRKQWQAAAEAFQSNENILFALPLYVENIPGLMLEFLEGLNPKTKKGTRIAFILQGGFPEGSQSRCCEKYLETLPKLLGCEYAGTLIKGDMFGLSLTEEKQREKMLEPYIEMGRLFCRTSCFDKKTSDAFAAPEYMPESQIRMFNIFGRTVQKIFMGRIAKKMGCRGRLDAKPYEINE
ncbi:MAG: hypothetical protein PUD43_01300 [Clostridia bacterium]|nr:hypothetical protein [Clostridia bacterium]